MRFSILAGVLGLAVCWHGSVVLALRPAPVSCSAAYSDPCARTNSKYLAISTAEAFSNKLLALEDSGKVTDTGDVEVLLSQLFKEIQAKDHNMDTGFYPFVVRREDAICMAHGDHSEVAGLSLDTIFNDAGIGFADAEALHRRFSAAAEQGGGWVQYLWSDRRGSVDSPAVVINSKMAYVINLTSNYYLGVGYENEQLPPDVPCSVEFDGWCSITNVRSLVGAAQFRLERAGSLENFEAAIHELSFDADAFTIEDGFYPFLYKYDGSLKAHAKLHDFFGLNISEIFERNELGSREEGSALHARFIAAANAQQDGSGSGWVKYSWRNKLDESTYSKIAFITKIVSRGEEYYLGVGYKFAMQEVVRGPLDAECSSQYNLPCAFQKTLRLSSHSLSHAVTAEPEHVKKTFNDLSTDPSFRSDDFYIFVYDFNGTCVSHGQNPDYVGMTLTEVYELKQISVDATELHEKFRTAASRGGGWVDYIWLDPYVVDSEFEKMSYIFQLNIGGRTYYGGVGFNHKRAPVQLNADFGLQKNGVPIPCSQQYGLHCSNINVQAILGQALAMLSVAASPVSSTNKYLSMVLHDINYGSKSYRVNDFYVSVFSEDGDGCFQKDGSGCCIADGNNPYFVGLTWQQILDEKGIVATQGELLHKRLSEQSNTGGGWVNYPWSNAVGEAQTKIAYTARFREGSKSYYVVAEYLETAQPIACDACPKGSSCPRPDQFFCEEDPATPWIKEPAFGIFLVVVLCLGICTVFCFSRHTRRVKAFSDAKILVVESQLKEATVALDQSMQGMVTVVRNMLITSPEQYKMQTSAAAGASSSVVIWLWEEDDCRLVSHESSRVLEDTNFVRYQQEISGQIEHAYQRYVAKKGHSTFFVDLGNRVTKMHNASTGANFEINFDNMTQQNTRSSYHRAIRRDEIDIPIDSESADLLPSLPQGIDFGTGGEVLLPTFKDQVIQISKVHPDKRWLFGNVLYDPLVTEALEQQQLPGFENFNSILANALHDRPTSGWFPKDVTKPADLSVMRKLLDTLGGAGAEALLKPPKTWGKSDTEGRMRVQEGTKEYLEVSDYFLAALHDQREHVTIESIRRIQNMQLWQSYSVKKQTLKIRDQKHPEHRVNNPDLESVERCWLFHGTNAKDVEKIEKQGFNRAFAGRNGDAYGRGVYFARDASYSSHTKFSEPDRQGVQRMLLCRVAVGDWCKGTHGQLTPNPKPHNNLELFDTTVDNERNPSVFVVYHDAQAYPDYVVSFKDINVEKTAVVEKTKALTVTDDSNNKVALETPVSGPLTQVCQENFDTELDNLIAAVSLDEEE